MAFVITTGGMARWARIQWAPSLTSHNPNPPLPLLTAPPAGLQAVRFDNSADVLTMPAAALPSGSGAWTLAGWFRLVNDRNAVSTLWSLDGLFSSSWHSLRTDVTGTALKLNESGTDLISIATLTVGVWYFVAVRKDAAGNVKTYVGTEAGGALSTVTGSITNIATYSGDGYVMGNAYGDWADGRAWGLRVWDAELSDAEVDAEFIASTRARTTNNRAQWLLDNATTPGTDSSGNSRDLTNTGGAWALEAGPTLPSGGATITGSVAVTLGNATSATSGAHGVAGSVAQTLANATSAASGSTVTGSVSRTLADATSATSGAHGVAGTVARTLADAAPSIAGSSVSGSVARTLADATAAISGTAGGTTVTGTVAVTLADATSSGAGSSVAGSVARTLADVAPTISGARGAAGAVARTLADTTSAIAGARGAAGTVAQTLAGATSAAAGSTVAGSVARTLGNATSAIAGVQGPFGTVAATLGNATATASGSTVAGSVSRTLADVTAAVDGLISQDVTGSVDVVLQGMSAAIAGVAEPPTFASPGGGLRRMRRSVSVG